VETPSFWFVAQTKPRREFLACQNLERQGYLTLLPLIKSTKSSRRRQGVTEVLFPGYIFFSPSVGQSIAPVRSTVGVSRVVRFGQEPARLAHQLLDQILQFVGLADAEPGGLAARFNRLVGGTTVEVTRGPFSGLTGLVRSLAEERVLVLLELLGKTHELAFEPDALRAV
jgi:transcriptional antiterminator RfaH